MFVAAPIAPKTDETFLALKALHPYTKPTSLPLPTHDPPKFTEPLVRQALFSFAPTSAAGLFGYRPAILQQCARAESFHFVPTLTRAVNVLASGEAPLFLQPFLAGGVSIALAKPNRGVRPLCCGDPLRRLVAKCFCAGGSGEISTKFQGKNFGVGCPGGVEAVAHSLRDVLQKHRKSGLALLKIDFKNAFNLLDRNWFVEASSKMFAGLERWTWWCYHQPPLLVYDHSRQFFSQSGVQQGDPLGPLYFCCGLQTLIDQISELCPVYQKWYMDDGGIVGSPELLLKVWEILKTGGEPLGLHLNPAKCEWSWLDPDCSLECPIANVPITPTDKIQMLGVPLGSAEFTDEFVKNDLCSATEGVMSKLVEFEDTQAALYLLRLSFGICRATHFMRTTPLSLWSNQANKFDTQVGHTVFHCLGLKPTPEAYEQASVGTTTGNSAHCRPAKGAFTESWHEAQGVKRKLDQCLSREGLLKYLRVAANSIN